MKVLCLLDGYFTDEYCLRTDKAQVKEGFRKSTIETKKFSKETLCQTKRFCRYKHGKRR